MLPPPPRKKKKNITKPRENPEGGNHMFKRGRKLRAGCSFVKQRFMKHLGLRKKKEEHLQQKPRKT